MNPVTLQKVKNNWHIALRSASTWAGIAGYWVIDWWLGKTAVEKVDWLKAHELFAALIPYVTIISTIIFVASRLWPQKIKRPPEVRDERVLQLDEILKQAQAAGVSVTFGAQKKPEEIADMVVERRRSPPPPPTAIVDPLFDRLRAIIPTAKDDTIVAAVHMLRSEGVDIDPTHPAFTKEPL